MRLEDFEIQEPFPIEDIVRLLTSGLVDTSIFVADAAAKGLVRLFTITIPVHQRLSTCDERVADDISIPAVSESLVKTIFASLAQRTETSSPRV